MPSYFKQAKAGVAQMRKLVEMEERTTDPAKLAELTQIYKELVGGCCYRQRAGSPQRCSKTGT